MARQAAAAGPAGKNRLADCLPGGDRGFHRVRGSAIALVHGHEYIAPGRASSLVEFGLRVRTSVEGEFAFVMCVNIASKPEICHRYIQKYGLNVTRREKTSPV